MKIKLSEIKKSFRSSKGFTLIELLVVIGILGILASALVATIDPIEQFKKADDANAKNIAVEFQSAVVRYYTVKSTTPCNVTTATALSSATTCTGPLITEQELKSSFTNNQVLLARVFVTVNQTTGVSTACFDPKSRSGDLDPNTRYTNTGGPTSTCPAAGSTLCFWCAK